jgi:hypothetical protein
LAESVTIRTPSPILAVVSDPEVTRICVEVLGVVIPLDVRGSSLCAAVSQAWRDCRTTRTPEVAGISVAIGSGDAPVDVSGKDAREVLHRLSPTITQRAITAQAGELIMLHAAALAVPSTGATAILVAESGTGKTTASRALGVDLAYLTDETAGITDEGRMVPYRKPLSLIEGGALKTQRAASSLGLTLTDGDCHLAAIVFLDRQPDHEGGPTVSTLDTIDAIAALAPQCSYLPSTHRPLHRLADLLHRTGGAHLVTYREAATLEPVLLQLLDRAP